MNVASDSIISKILLIILFPEFMSCLLFSLCLLNLCDYIAGHSQLLHQAVKEQGDLRLHLIKPGHVLGNQTNHDIKLLYLALGKLENFIVRYLRKNIVSSFLLWDILTSITGLLWWLSNKNYCKPLCKNKVLYNCLVIIIRFGPITAWNNWHQQYSK